MTTSPPTRFSTILTDVTLAVRRGSVSAPPGGAVNRALIGPVLMRGVCRLPTRTDLARSALPISRIAAAPIICFGVFLYAAELRTYGLGAVVCVVLGAGSGWGWHYFVDTAGAAVVVSAATSSVRQDPVNPPPLNPLASRPGRALDVPRPSDLSNVRQPARHYSHKLCSKGRACRKYLARG
jgi:hypothetical protein